MILYQITNDANEDQPHPQTCILITLQHSRWSPCNRNRINHVCTFDEKKSLHDLPEDEEEFS